MIQLITKKYWFNYLKENNKTLQIKASSEQFKINDRLLISYVDLENYEQLGVRIIANEQMLCTIEKIIANEVDNYIELIVKDKEIVNVENFIDHDSVEYKKTESES